MLFLLNTSYVYTASGGMENSHLCYIGTLVIYNVY